MADLAQTWGSDLSLTSTGDLQLASGSEGGRQRVLRRLLTNPGDYIWHGDYGAGLPAKVGSLVGAPGLEAAVRRQMQQEKVVSQDPPPTVKARSIFNGVSVSIVYRDADTGEAIPVGFDIER